MKYDDCPLWEDRSLLPPFICNKLIFQNNCNVSVVTGQHKIHKKITLHFLNHTFLPTNYLGLTKYQLKGISGN